MPVIPNAVVEPVRDSDRIPPAYTDIHPVSGAEDGTPDPEIIYGRSDGYDTESPDTERFGDSDGDTTSRRRGTGRRGRPFGSKNKEKSVRVTALTIKDLLYSLHLMGAEILKTPEIQMEQSEAKMLADAIADVNQHFNIAGLNPKNVAIFNLIAIAGGLYGTRFYAWRARLAREKEERRQSPVTPINRPSQQARPMPEASASQQPQGPVTMAPSDVFGRQSAEL